MAKLWISTPCSTTLLRSCGRKAVNQHPLQRTFCGAAAAPPAEDLLAELRQPDTDTRISNIYESAEIAATINNCTGI